jgi:hypothetical protein
MDRHFRDLIGRKGQRAILCVSMTAIISGKFLPYIHERKIHPVACGRAALLFGRGDQNGADSRTLSRRVNRKQSEISPFSPNLGVNASHKRAVFEAHQKPSFFHKRSDFVGISAVGIDEETLGSERGIDHLRDGRSVGPVGGSNLRRSWQHLGFYREVKLIGRGTVLRGADPADKSVPAAEVSSWACGICCRPGNAA